MKMAERTSVMWRQDQPASYAQAGGFHRRKLTLYATTSKRPTPAATRRFFQDDSGAFCVVDSGQLDATPRHKSRIMHTLPRAATSCCASSAFFLPLDLLTLLDLAIVEPCTTAP